MTDLNKLADISQIASLVVTVIAVVYAYSQWRASKLAIPSFCIRTNGDTDLPDENSFTGEFCSHGEIWVENHGDLSVSEIALAFIPGGGESPVDEIIEAVQQRTRSSDATIPEFFELPALGPGASKRVLIRHQEDTHSSIVAIFIVYRVPNNPRRYAYFASSRTFHDVGPVSVVGRPTEGMFSRADSRRIAKHFPDHWPTELVVIGQRVFDTEQS